MGEVPPNIARRNLPSSHPVREGVPDVSVAKQRRWKALRAAGPKERAKRATPFSSGGSGGDWVPPREGGRTKIVEKEKVRARRRREGPARARPTTTSEYFFFFGDFCVWPPTSEGPEGPRA
jgi:hypothetical protein